MILGGAGGVWSFMAAARVLLRFVTLFYNGHWIILGGAGGVWSFMAAAISRMHCLVAPPLCCAYLSAVGPVEDVGCKV